ncbi:hypothetical protein ANANG_G00163850, partial [Anguilla anguilla]
PTPTTFFYLAYSSTFTNKRTKPVASAEREWCCRLLTLIGKYKGRRMYYTEDNLGPRLPCLESHSHPQDNWSYIMYHGTTREAAESIMRFGFCPSKDGMLGRGVYVSRDPQKASRYPLNVHPANRLVLELQVDVGKVKRIDRQGHPLQKTWHDAGYDTAWVPPNVAWWPVAWRKTASGTP